nr:immunoglobulin light chain junction region [Macaca mulatta]MOV35382.1 immunoglobulin light chain junction region [Macaca mulatta]MOV35414.1 immunoglobulin light chain junction region [Macaca mulatta]
CQHGYGTPVTF